MFKLSKGAKKLPGSGKVAIPLVNALVPAAPPVSCTESPSQLPREGGLRLSPRAHQPVPSPLGALPVGVAPQAAPGLLHSCLPFAELAEKSANAGLHLETRWVRQVWEWSGVVCKSLENTVTTVVCLHYEQDKHLTLRGLSSLRSYVSRQKEIVLLSECKEGL